MEQLIQLLLYSLSISFVVFLIKDAEVFSEFREKIKYSLKLRIVSGKKVKKIACQKVLYMIECHSCLATWVAAFWVTLGFTVVGVSPWLGILYYPAIVTAIYNKLYV